MDNLWQYLATFSVLLIIMTSGMHYAWPSPSLPRLSNGSESFQITSDEGSWIAVMQLLGGPIGCIIGGFISDRIGRKLSILISAVPFFISWLMVAYAQSAMWLILARFLAGLPDGLAFTVIPLYIGEIADPKIRGQLGSCISGTWIIGMLLINIIGSYFDIRTTALISSVLPVLFFVLFMCMPESPYYLLLKDRPDDAKQILQKFRGNKLINDEFDCMKVALKEQMQNRSSIFELFTNKLNLRCLLMLVILRNAQQLSGVAAIIFYTQTIFQEGDTSLSPEICTFIYVTLQASAAFLCSFIVDKTGRRPLLFISLTGSGIAHLLLTIYFYLKTNTTIDTSSFNSLPLIALIIYVILFNCGTQPIPLVIQGEILPTNIKSASSGFAEMYFCIIASIVSKCFQIINDSFGMYLPFLIFAICCFIHVGIVAVCIPETKGKSLEVIQEELTRNNVDKKCKLPH